MSQPETAEKLADPWSIDGTLTRCIGITQSINKRISELESKTAIYLVHHPEKPLSEIREIPADRSEHAIRLESLYTELSAIESKLDRLYVEFSE